MYIIMYIIMIYHVYINIHIYIDITLIVYVHYIHIMCVDILCTNIRYMVQHGAYGVGDSNLPVNPRHRACEDAAGHLERRVSIGGTSTMTIWWGNWNVCTYGYIWGFPEVGVPPNHIQIIHFK